MIRNFFRDYFSDVTRRQWAIHGSLFFLTFLTTTFIGAVFYGTPEHLLQSGLTYSVPLLCILLSHEMGHYLQAKKYGVRASLPYFIPLPVPFIGTMGAIIRMKSLPPDKKAMFDIAFWGPAMSFILSVPCFIVGLKFSSLIATPVNHEGMVGFGDSLLTLGLSELLFTVPPGYTLLAHPLIMAAWVGFLVTAMNLIPAGQLDGGHIAYAVFGKRQKQMAYLSLIVLAILALQYHGWVVWLLLIVFLLKPEHPDYTNKVALRRISQNLSIETAFNNAPLDKKRRWLGFLSFGILILSFIPYPIEEFTRVKPEQPPTSSDPLKKDLRVELNLSEKG